MIKSCKLFSVSIMCVLCLASSADAEDICGDAVCDGVETCVSCADDCGECNPPIVVVETFDTTTDDNPPGTESCQVMLHINEPGVRLLAVANADISTDDPDGFFQHPFGSLSTAPDCFLVSLLPDLAQDSYVTVGAECEGIPSSGSSAGPDFDSSLFNFGGQVVGGWFIASPPNGFGDPDEDGNVLIAQFTYGQTHNTCGEMIAYVQGDFGLPEPECPDLDGSGDVGASDLAAFLGNWGEPCDGCPYDFNGDGEVDMVDLVILFASWGPCDQEILPIVGFPVSFQCQGPPCFIPPIVVVETFDTTTDDNPPGTESCQVMLHINEPGVRLLAVANADISTDDPDGFFQHPFGSLSTAPDCFLVSLLPDLAQDSYVTVGAECEGIPSSGSSAGPDFDSSLFNFGGQVVGGWFIASPPNGFGDPDEDGNVLIAQFTYGQTHNTCGEMIAYVQGDFGLPEPECPDLDGSGDVGASDLAAFLGNWGEPCDGCPYDFNGDGEVDMVDLVILFASWGPCDQEILPIVGFPVSFQCSGPPCFIDIEAIAKWTQDPDPDLGAGIPSSVDMQTLAEQVPGDPGPGPNAAVADNFVSDGRPTTHVRWWGSYLDPAFGPGGEKNVDAYLISFFAGNEGADQPDTPLGTYGCETSVVQIEATEFDDAGGLPVYEYIVPLELCCVLVAENDLRDTSTDQSPAQNDAFLDVANFLYWIDIQAVVGRSYVRANDSCSVLETDNPASAPFWAWQSSQFDCPAHSAQGNLVMDENGDIGYANWEQVSAAQYNLKTVDQAYELLTLIKTCEQDFTGLESIPDGKVGAGDLANLLGSWGAYSPCNEDGYRPADFDKDARVGAFDLAQLLGKWGPCRCYENSDCPSEECVPAPPESFYDFECVPVE